MKHQSPLLNLKPVAVASLILTATHCAWADAKLPSIFSDHMVLQQDTTAPVWGWADPGEEITVNFAGQSKTVTTGADGKWKVALEKLKASSSPQELEVKGKNSLTVKDVLVGEVWLDSGQSNMSFEVQRGKDFKQEQAAANYPEIRMFFIGSHKAVTPQDNCPGKWVVCAPETVATFAAPAYFFGRDVQKELHYPMGLINASQGATSIEDWISSEPQKQAPELKPFFEAHQAIADAQLANEQDDKGGAAAPAPAARPRARRAAGQKTDVGQLFNGKIAPLIPYAIRGVIWYQGEANARPGKAQFYQYQLPLLVKDWRAHWGYEFPFAWVQLPNFTREGDYMMLVREAMLKSLVLPKTGMAVTIDIGEAKNLHPVDKQDVGLRLSLWALSDVYGKKGVPSSGPLPAAHEIHGSEAVISFTHTDGGLSAKDGTLKGFAIAGEDKKWMDATAKIVGDTVVVSSPDIKQPVAVRYAWKDNPECNLYNGAGLPASPFRTDTW